MARPERIKELLYDYVGVVTYTGTPLEKNAEGFFEGWFNSVDYLKDHPDQCGFYDCKDDYLERKIPWALLKGKGDKTVVLVHHTDTVDTDDYGVYKDIAHKPDELYALFKQGKFTISPEVQKDVDSGEWVFGRGASDMKSGGAMHMALFEEYSQEEDFEGNVLLLGLPDEENSSAGMRSAAYLMKDLKDKYGLDYVLMIDGEPHERVDESKYTIYDGAVGKVMPIFLARGKLSHVGQIYQGFNPINLLSAVVRKTELLPEFVETVGTTTAPGPCWLYMKDRKEVYDVSLPLTAGGYMSVLPLTRTPKDIVDRLKELSIEAFDEVIADMKEAYKPYKAASLVDYGDLNYTSKVKTYDELYSEVLDQDPANKEVLDQLEKDLVAQIRKGDFDRVEASFRLMEKTLSLHKDRDPMLVIGIAAPYYPAVNNRDLDNFSDMEALLDDLAAFSRETCKTDIEVQNYFTGICDLSYGMFTESDETIDYIENNMLLWGSEYEIPLHLIKDMSMPVLNIGAWGKDLHMYTERIKKEDLFENIPKLSDFVIRKCLD
ncbi:MAG: M20/M25/M40 family metallo-hydrolase [Tissierellia bacterium]|nr:M20/M25/M40 family metallo-hydrolase [Tissierellia bacterium]